MILVTGGTGFIGSHTAVELVSAGYEVVLLDNLCNSTDAVSDGIGKITGKNIPLIRGDVRDEKLLAETFRKYRFDAVIHFAALKAVPESYKKPLEYYDNNVAGLTTLVAQAEKNKVDKFVFSSSAAVYGSKAKSPIPESQRVDTDNSPYGMSKIACEKIVVDTAHANPDFKTVSLRYFNPVGAHESALIGELPQGIPNNLVPYLVQVAAGIREKLTVFGRDYPTRDGTCIRDFMHVTDLARAHVAALSWLTKKNGEGKTEAFNLGTGKGTSVLELIRAFEAASGRSLKYEFGPRREGDVAELYADATKAEKELGWRAELTLENAMRSAWKWAEALRSAKG